jgi:hypothetical protein
MHPTTDEPVSVIVEHSFVSSKTAMGMDNRNVQRNPVSGLCVPTPWPSDRAKAYAMVCVLERDGNHYNARHRGMAQPGMIRNCTSTMKVR